MSTRTAESISKIARKNPVSSRVWWIGGLVAAATGVVVFLATRPAKAAAPVVVRQLTTGHRYGITLSCPTALPGPLPTDNASAQAWLGLPGAVVVSFKQTSPNSLALEFDYSGPATQLPPIQSGGATACKTQLSDMGASP